MYMYTKDRIGVHNLNKGPKFVALPGKGPLKTISDLIPASLASSRASLALTTACNADTLARAASCAASSAAIRCISSCRSRTVALWASARSVAWRAASWAVAKLAAATAASC